MEHTKEKPDLASGREKNYIVLFCGLSFWGGCLLAQYLEPGPWLWMAAAAAALLGWVLYRLRCKPIVALCLLMAVLGVLRTQPCLYPSVPQPGQYEQITGYVYGEPVKRSDERITFELCDVRLNGAAQQGHAYCSLYLQGEREPKLYDGTALSMSGKVYLPEGKSGSPRFDFRSWMLQNGLSYGITLSGQNVEVLNTPQTAPVKDQAGRLNAFCRAGLERVMGDSAGIASAMLLGQREQVAQEEYTAFQRLGIAHVMTVSGLHVGLLGMALMWLLDRFRLSRKWQLLPMGLFLAVYCAVTGFSAAALRASVMLLLYMLAGLWGRRSDLLTTLGAALLAVLVIDPLQAGSAGLLLSFSAVFAIGTLSPGLKRVWQRVLPLQSPRSHRDRALRSRLRCLIYRLRRKLRNAFCMSLSAQLGVLLPTAQYFHSLPLYGVALNVLILPLVGVLVPLYGITLLLSPIPGAGQAAGMVASTLTELFRRLVSLLAQLPYASVRVGSPGLPWIAAGAALMVLLSHCIRGKVWQKALAAALICFTTGTVSYAMRPPDTRYIQLSVGQQDAALLFAGDQTVAIDVGEDASATLDYLMESGRDLDALYLTHLHLDHAGGVQALLDADIRIGRAYLPAMGDRQKLQEEALAPLKALEQAGIPVAFLDKGQQQSYHDVTVTVLWPEADTVRPGQDANHYPLALGIDLQGYTILNAADLTGLYEKYAAIPCDVLKAAHHGSKDSTGEEFLQFTSPGLAIISCSGTSSSLPGQDTLARLGQQGIPVLRTDESGDITLWVQQGALEIAPYKARKDQ